MTAIAGQTMPFQFSFRAAQPLRSLARGQQHNIRHGSLLVAY